MALGTGGTTANNSLNSLLFSRAMAAGDVGALAALIKDDGGTVQGTTGDRGSTGVVVPTGFDQQGLLVIPNRGVLRCYPGDYVMVDTTTGWPILVSALAIASGPWNP